MLSRHYTLKLQIKSLSHCIHRITFTRWGHPDEPWTDCESESVSLSHRVRVTTIKNLVFSGEGWITGESVHKPLLEVLNGKRQAVPPVWMMRQAGRYLPEYMAVRKNVGGVLDLCFAPKLAAEVTLQPIRRFGFDAAILFSDILVVPHALGRSVRFEAGEGPRLEPFDDPAAMAALRSTIDDAVLAPIYETIRLVKAELPSAVTFLGFCGGPWTVATYMVAGRGTPDQAPARLFAYRHP